MLRNKFVILVVGLLLSVVVIYNINFFLKKRPGAGSSQEPVRAVRPDDQGKAEGLRITSQLPLPRDREQWRRDPFQYTAQHAGENSSAVKPDGRGKKKAAGIKLEGIKVRDGKYFALVNGWVVKPGDRIVDVTITDITPYSIFVKDAEGIREISIYHHVIDKEK